MVNVKIDPEICLINNLLGCKMSYLHIARYTK
uniref:Uncharacterized protein n=1 Tax=Arundo donax TaxID=35708 RepID=A0A0A9FEV3_ARUDO